MDLDLVEFATRVKLRGMPYARRLIDSAKIRLGSFRLPLEWDVDDAAFAKDLEKLSQYVPVAAEIGCTRCVCTIQPAGDKRPYHENFEFHRRRFAEICRVLEPGGIRLGVGIRGAEGLRRGRAFQFVHDMDALSLLVSMVGAPNIGVLVDSWDLHLSGASIDALRGMSAQQIVAVRLSDQPADVRPADLTDQDRLLPGTTGQIDSVAVLVALSELGYDGPVTPIADRKSFENTRRDRIVRQAGEAMDKVWRAAGLAVEGRTGVRS
jgi:sugar phosphate isomerase/epimerase